VRSCSSSVRGRSTNLGYTSKVSFSITSSEFPHRSVFLELKELVERHAIELHAPIRPPCSTQSFARRKAVFSYHRCFR
jgi:hypothetical protein